MNDKRKPFFFCCFRKAVLILSMDDKKYRAGKEETRTVFFVFILPK